MKYRIRKALLWLMMTLMVLFGVAGCGSGMTAEEKAQALQAAGEVVEAVLEAAEDEEAEETDAVRKAGTEESERDWIPEQDEAAVRDDGQQPQEKESEQIAHTDELDKNGSYTSKEAVAAYIHTYGHLPDNFITKKEAGELGWNSKEGNLWEVAPGKSIGGSKFGNYEGLLPEKKGRNYYECDIDYEGGYRGAKRIIYSNDGLIFYTDDHYESFEQMY